MIENINCVSIYRILSYIDNIYQVEYNFCNYERTVYTLSKEWCTYILKIENKYLYKDERE